MDQGGEETAFDYVTVDVMDKDEILDDVADCEDSSDSSD